MSEQLLTLNEVAERLRVSRSAVERWVRSGELPSYKLGEGRTAPRRVSEGDLSSFVAKRRTTE